MAGLYGGGLRSVSDDGWSVEHVGGNSLLHPPKASIHFLKSAFKNVNKDTTFYLLDRAGEDIRALGFSWSGRSVITASPNTLSIWGRPAPLTL